MSADFAITAMFRIRNEEEFLDAAVRSVADLVDRILLVDNLSTDRSRKIIERLGRDYSDKAYESTLRWTQRLSGPYAAKSDADIYRYHAAGPCFLHMKFCKRDPWSNYSDELAAVISANVDTGPPLPPDWLDVLKKHGHSDSAACARD